MADSEHIDLIKSGVETWNSWRTEFPENGPGLRLIDFEKEFRESNRGYDMPEFNGYNFSDADFYGVTLRNCDFNNCVFDGSKIHCSDLCFANFTECSFRGVEMRLARIGSANFYDCTFEDCDFSYTSAGKTGFCGSQIKNCTFDHMSLVQTNFTNASIHSTSVYGTSAWDLVLDGTDQRDIIIAGENGAVTVDNIEIAQFIYLLINNSRIRDVIDTLTSKVVLILGRFSPNRKRVLDELRDLLRKNGYVPVLFDFDKPQSRDLTETISTIAHLSRFVIADLTDAKSVPQELTRTIPHLPSVPVQPIIAKDNREYGMFEHLERYSWVLDIAVYSDDKLVDFADSILQKCESAVQLAHQG